jgi:hypothetical protein
MEFTVDQRFPVAPADVLALYADPAFFTSLSPTDRLATPQLVDHEDLGDRVVMRLRHRLTAELPAMVTRFVDPAKLTWVEVTDLNRTTGRSTSQLLPDDYPELLRASASATFVATDTGTQRTVTGRVEVPVPIFGGKVEGAIVEGLEEYLVAEAAEAVRRLGGH